MEISTGIDEPWWAVQWMQQDLTVIIEWMPPKRIATVPSDGSTQLPPLPDYLEPGLELVFVGFNPGERSARLGHYYAGIGNLFWRGLSESGLVPGPLTFSDDCRLPQLGIGLTDLAKQPSRSITHLPKEQFQRGRAALRRKLLRVHPQVIAFIGKGVYELFTNQQCELGAQCEPICGAAAFVLPSTSARNASVSRQEKLEWFRRLNEFVRTIRAEPVDRSSPQYVRKTPEGSRGPKAARLL